MSNEPETFYPANRNDWRTWLRENHAEKQSVWLICYKKSSGMPTISWSEAVEEALCFGWIDSTRKPIDEQKFMQYFSRRKAQSTWSKINKLKIEQLIADGLMAQAGFDSIETAKQNGSWTILDAVEELMTPEDLTQALAAEPDNLTHFNSLSRSDRRYWLQWLALAKRPETRLKRIGEITLRCAQKLRPNM